MKILMTASDLTAPELVVPGDRLATLPSGKPDREAIRRVVAALR